MGEETVEIAIPENRIGKKELESVLMPQKERDSPRAA
jgi:hypothetical protein